MRHLAPIGVVLLISGCINEAPEEPPRQAESRVDPENPCELLSPQQVEAAIGTEVNGEREVDSHDPTTRICLYGTTKPWASVALSLEDDVSAQDFEEELGRDPPNTEQVDGIGDGAFIHGCSGITVYASDVAAGASLQHLTTCDETRVVLEKLGRAIERSVRTASAP